MHKTVLVLAAIAVVAICSQARADECDAVLGELSATISGLDVGERVTSTGNSDTVALKHAAADDIKLSCTPPGAHQPNQMAVAWHSAYPPPAYFDLLAAAGAIVATNSPAVVRKGALACQKQALIADIENTQVDLAGVHFDCSVSTRNGGRIAITVSSSRNELDLTQKTPPETKDPPKKTTTKKGLTAKPTGE